MTALVDLDEMLWSAADKLGALRERVVFVGGAVRGLLVTDPGAADARPTDDVDVVVEVASYPHYHELDAELRGQGFINDASPGAPACRYLHGALKLDLMPTEKSILGFSNPWYPHAFATCGVVELRHRNREALRINLISAPCFVATKLVAFRARGGGDLLHHDLEDIVALVDGRESLGKEIASDTLELRTFVAAEFSSLLEQGLASALRGHLAHDASGDLRLPILRARMQAVAELT